MKVLFVVNNYYASGNGLSASARRTVKYLKEAGVDVRVISGRNHEAPEPQPDYILDDYKVPIFDKLIQAHGYKFADVDRAVMKEALAWADVVHLEEPFIIEWFIANMAHDAGIPVTGTYHLHPENIFFSLGMGNWKLPNQIMMNLWKNLCFNEWKYVQCPTQNVKDRLEANGFKADLRVISNGLVPDACIRVPHQNQPFLLICIGRLSGEKSPYTLLEAMKHSSFAKNIQLFFAGKGPEEKKVRKMAKKLYEDGVVAYEPLFDFMDRDGLRNLAAKADLAIHCATIEVEGLSIMEAMQQGVVPIIADGPITGTHQFAIDERSRFAQKDAVELAQKIDWWLSHPAELEAARGAYVEEMKKYSIEYSVRELIKMFRDATQEK